MRLPLRPFPRRWMTRESTPPGRSIWPVGMPTGRLPCRSPTVKRPAPSLSRRRRTMPVPRSFPRGRLPTAVLRCSSSWMPLPLRTRALQSCSSSMTCLRPAMWIPSFPFCQKTSFIAACRTCREIPWCTAPTMRKTALQSTAMSPCSTTAPWWMDSGKATAFCWVC